MRAPKFWTHPGLLSNLLSPLGKLYSYAVARRRTYHIPVKVSVPVICIGNLLMGGSGKTTVTAKIVSLLKEYGYSPHILSRGYKASLKETTCVNPDCHSPKEVGDEPYLLSAYAPVWIGADRVKSAQAAIQAGADILVMDDGFQNPFLYKDLSLLVFDGEQQLGNGCVFPAGPLRETLEQGLSHCQGIILINFASLPEWCHDRPVFQAKIKYQKQPEHKNYLAFAGIGFPEKFFNGLKDQGFQIVETQSFADHYLYQEQDIKHLKEKASSLQATLITTLKDYVKIPENMRENIEVQEIALDVEQEIALINYVLKNVKVDK